MMMLVKGWDNYIYDKHGHSRAEPAFYADCETYFNTLLNDKVSNEYY